jgi:hypothetical protein
MAKASRFLKEKFLNVRALEALGDKERVATISHVTIKRMRDGQRLVVYFTEAIPPLPLNETRVAQLIELHGGDDDTDHWRGSKVRLDIDPSVEYRGDVVGSITINPAS